MTKSKTEVFIRTLSLNKFNNKLDFKSLYNFVATHNTFYSDSKFI